MDAKEKIDLLCSEHMNGLTTVWAVTKCIEDINDFLIICVDNGIISNKEHIDLINHYTMCAGERIMILEDMDD